MTLASGWAGPVPAYPPTRWDALTAVLAGVILQYVWRLQEVFPMLRFVQFTALVSVGAVVLFVLDGSPTRRVSFLRHGLYRLTLAIFALALLSVPTSMHDGGSVDFLTTFVKTVVLAGVVAAAIRDHGDVQRMVRVFVLGGAGYILAAKAFFSDGGRLGGSGSYDPNDLGLFAVTTIPLCVYLMRRGARQGDKIIGLGSAALLLFGTVQSGSRGGFLALVALGLYGLLALDAVRSSKRFTVVVVGAGLIVAVGGGAYWDRMRTILNPQEDYNWTGQESGRLEVWKRGLGYMIRRPFFGVGVNQFDVAEGALATGARNQGGVGFKWSAAHSAYVQIGAEVGVLGLVAFVALLVTAFREARRIGRTAATQGDRLLGQVFGGQVVGFAVGAAFLSQAYAPYLYFALAILIGFSRVVARESAQSQAAFIPQPELANRGSRRAVAASGRRRGR